MLRTIWKSLLQQPLVRLILLGAGLICILLAPLLSPLPGPGGTLLFAVGLGLVLQTSAWARRRYVRFKRRYPRPGHWVDWGLRRASYKRRRARKKQSSDD
jgi:hypothetical protein